MSATTKFQTSCQWKWGQQNVIPYAGLVQYDKEGFFIAKVTAEQTECLLKALPDLIAVSWFHEVNQHDLDVNPDLAKQGTKLGDEIEIPIKPQVIEEDDLGQAEQHELGSTADDNNDLLKALDKMNVADMRDLAQTSGFTEEDWKTLNKTDLKAYLVSKLSVPKI